MEINAVGFSMIFLFAFFCLGLIALSEATAKTRRHGFRRSMHGFCREFMIASMVGLVFTAFLAVTSLIFIILIFAGLSA